MRFEYIIIEIMNKNGIPLTEIFSLPFKIEGDPSRGNGYNLFNCKDGLD